MRYSKGEPMAELIVARARRCHRRISGSVVAAALWAAAFAEPALASNATERCAALMTTDLSMVPDAPTKITQARWVTGNADTPSYCEVQGYVSPSVGIEILLPGSTWNGKLLKAGCGGFCGSTRVVQICEGALRRGYACIASDMGHKSTPTDGVWAYNNLLAKIDWGFRAVHVAALAGKAIVARYFDTIPKRSYFFGCSTGGRQALIAAQRFPWDFDGIIAGAPPLEHTRNNLNVLWNHRAVLDERGKSVLMPADAELVHRAVLKRCDANDGLEDGIIDDPRTCKFDPAELICKADKQGGCLSARQVEAVGKLYSGPVTFPGEHSATGTLMPGSELNWIGMYFSQDGGRGHSYQYQTDKMRYSAFMPDPGPRWQLSDLDFAADPKRFGVMESLYAANNPDLRKFKKAGGKLILFHGWGDQGDFPLAAVDYYETTERTMGGRDATQDFFRLFMVPGMGHCTGGEGAYLIDYLSYLEDWVEKGQPPDRLIGVHPNDPQAVPPLAFGLYPLDPAQIKFSRPIYPYPARAMYSGHGDPNAAASFKRRSP
jgi:hypothetical protein